MAWFLKIKIINSDKITVWNGFWKLESTNKFSTINETTNSPIHQFKVLQNVFKMKKQDIKCFFKVMNKKSYTVIKGFLKALWPLCSNLNSWIGELENSWFRLLMSRTGQLSWSQIDIKSSIFTNINLRMASNLLWSIHTTVDTITACLVRHCLWGLRFMKLFNFPVFISYKFTYILLFVKYLFL